MGLSVDAFAERVVSGETVEETTVDVPSVSKGITAICMSIARF